MNIKEKTKRINDSILRYGWTSFVSACFKKLGINLNILDPIQKKRNYLSKKIEELTDNKVLGGIYKNTKLIKTENYFAKPAQLLGCYEQEVQDEIINFKKKFNLKSFVNVGAGEGYHAVGCLNSGIFEHCISFEMLEKNRENVKKNFLENDLKDNFLILSKAEDGFLNLILDKINFNNTLFLFDIEGDEFKLLNHQVLSELKESKMIIEFHHFYSDDINRKKLLSNIQKFFDIKWIKTQSRNFSQYKILNRFNDDKKWLMVSKNRPQTMQWAICEPKK